MTFGRSGKAALKGRSLTTTSRATCPGEGPDCTVTARATASVPRGAKVVVVADRAFTLNAGATARIKLTISRAAARLLKRKHRLTFVLALTGRRTGATTATVRRTITLKTKKR